MISFLSNAWVTLNTPPYLHLFVFAFALLTLGILGRIIGGFRPGKVAGLTANCCFTLIFVYVVAIAAFGSEGHSMIFSASLPFIGELSDGISLITLFKTNFITFMMEVTKVFFLSLTVSFCEIPAQKLYTLITRKIVVKILTALPLFYPWYIVKCLVVFAAIVINAFIHYLLSLISDTFAKWLPIIMFILLLILMVYLVLGIIFKTITFFSNPFSKSAVHFFGNTFIGKTIKSTFNTTMIIVCVIVLLDVLGVLTGMLTIARGTTIFVPVALMLIALGYLVWVFCF